MKYFLLAALISFAATPALANDLGISINIGQPGFYGQINLGNQYPRPQLIYPNPVLAMPPAVAVQQQPIYLYVPPGHAKKWSKHCHRYNACNQPVYFIQENWYNDVYVPQYRSQSNYSGDHYDSGRRHDGDDDSRNHSQRYGERVGIPMKTIKADATTATTKGVAMTSTEVSVITEIMTEKNRIGVIEEINAAMLK